MLRPKSPRRPSGGWDPVPTTILIGGWTGLDSSLPAATGMTELLVRSPQEAERIAGPCSGFHCIRACCGLSSDDPGLPPASSMPGFIQATASLE